MSFPEGSDGKPVLWVHHKISSKVIKHNCIFGIIKLQDPQNQYVKLFSQKKQVMEGQYLSTKPQEIEPISGQVVCNRITHENQIVL